MKIFWGNEKFLPCKLHIFVLTLKSCGFVANVKKSIWGEEEVSLSLRIILDLRTKICTLNQSKKHLFNNWNICFEKCWKLENYLSFQINFARKSIGFPFWYSVTITLKTKYSFGNKASKIQATSLKFHMIYYLQKFILTQRLLELEHNLQVKRKKFPFYNSLSSKENHKSSHRESQKQCNPAYF